MSRISALTNEQMSEEQRKVFEESRAMGAPTAGPYIAYLRAPDLMRLNREVGNYLRRCSLAGRLRQMVVLRTLKHWGAKFAWVVQVRNSLREGLEQNIIDAIEQGREPALSAPEDIAAMALCRELLETKQVRDATYRRALELFGERGIVDLTATIGFFTSISFTLNTFDIDPPSN